LCFLPGLPWERAVDPPELVVPTRIPLIEGRWSNMLEFVVPTRIPLIEGHWSNMAEFVVPIRILLIEGCWSDMPDLVVPARIPLIESCWSARTCGSYQDSLDQILTYWINGPLSRECW
jgi:hypothetical protein